jgi:hypothetical protein
MNPNKTELAITIKVQSHLILCADAGDSLSVVEAELGEDTLPMCEQMVAVSRDLA